MDAGDRLFFSLEKAWKSCQASIGDVKELIPELFYFPEMFVGRANYAFRQDGVPVSEVVKPAWSKNYIDLIIQHSKGLEHPAVTRRLSK